MTFINLNAHAFELAKLDAEKAKQVKRQVRTMQEHLEKISAFEGFNQKAVEPKDLDPARQRAFAGIRRAMAKIDALLGLTG